MEVASQWRREWAGTAEYGDFIEDGVTRRIARAMEVLHASAPGAKVRVVRAAYHSSAGPGGAGTASYLMHSTRRVFSSGFNLQDSSISQPLEITPLESSKNYYNEDQDYKVTEPDDTEISEPSKWKNLGETGIMQISSEESSSPDSSSIIDLDPHKRRSLSLDTDSSDFRPATKGIAQLSPFEEAPLNTLKFKSLLNDQSNCRNGRSTAKTEPVLHHINICNDSYESDSSKSKVINSRISDKTLPPSNENIFANKNKSQRILEPENKFALQSPGKVTISVPVKSESPSSSPTPIQTLSLDCDRKTKRVGFCKTELHFAAESGKVNIIPTDEKPPPVNDFRKRRSAFEPLRGSFEKPITLFGEKFDHHDLSRAKSEYSTYDDDIKNTTKSILKNKIPKPKPYYLGENIQSNYLKHSNDREISETISNFGKLENRVLKPVNCNNLLTTRSTVMTSTLSENHDASWLTSNEDFTTKSPLENYNCQASRVGENIAKIFDIESKNEYNKIKNDVERKYKNDIKPRFTTSDKLEGLSSVKLIKQITNPMNSEKIESESNYYQNFPIKHNLAPAPVPTPRVRSKYPTEKHSGSVHPSSTHNGVASQKYSRRNENCQDIQKSKPNQSSKIKSTSPLRCSHLSSLEKSRLTKIHDDMTGYTNVKSSHNLTDTEENSIPECENLYINIPIKKSKAQVQKYVEKDEDYTKNKNVKDSLQRKINSDRITDKSKISRDKTNSGDRKHKQSETQENSTRRKIKSTTHEVNHKHRSAEVQKVETLLEHEDISLINKGTNEKPRNKNDKKQNLTDTNSKHKVNKIKSRSNSTIKHLKSCKGQEHELESERNSSKSSKKSKIVINYDDKNGTVSSICKVKSRPSSRIRNVSKDNDSRHDSCKKNLLVSQNEHYRKQNTFSYGLKKKISKSSCAIL